VEELAEIANMGVSSLHRLFKEVTAMSPIQFQKHLRLQEARHLLLTEVAGAADVAFRVGYESPSQFSREYSRLFGLPPKEDIKRLKESYDHRIGA
jgi:transcriptional regulator GlxA family with amidase domain